MSSVHVTHLLSEYIDDKLSTAQFQKVKSHLVFCNACRYVLNDFQNNQRQLQNTPPVQPPAGLEEKILARLKASPIEEKKQSPASPPANIKWGLVMRNLGLVAACAVVFILVRQFPKNEKFATTSLSENKNIPVPLTAPMGNEAAPPIIADQDKKDALKLNASSQRGRDTSFDSETGVAGDSFKTRNPKTVDMIGGPDLGKQKKSQDERGIDMQEPTKREGLLSDKLQDRGDVSHAETIRGSIAAKAMASGGRMEAAGEKKEESKTNQGGTSRVDLHGQHSGVEEPMQKVIAKESEWEKLWTEHTRGQSPTPEVPVVDFETEEILALFIGNRPSGGYSVTITSIEETSWEGKPARIVYYKLSTPPAGMMATSVITQPYCLKSVPRIKGLTFFRQIP